MWIYKDPCFKQPTYFMEPGTLGIFCRGSTGYGVTLGGSESRQSGLPHRDQHVPKR